MKTLLMAALLLAIPWLAPGSGAEAAAAGRTLRGTVVDAATGRPVTVATVGISKLPPTSGARCADVDGSGKFTLEGLTPGKYLLQFRGRNFGLLTRIVEVVEGEQDVMLRVMLRSSSAPGSARSDVLVLAGAGMRILTDAEESALVASMAEPWKSRMEEAGREAWCALPQERAEAADLATPSYERGGRSGEVSFRVGGVAVEEPTGGRPRMQGNAPPRITAVLPDAFVQRKGEPLSDEALERLASDADEIWILERPGARRPVDPEQPGTGCIVVIDDGGVEVPIPLEHTDVRARIDGYVASVDVRQRFSNPFEETIEAEYLFPLPHDAAVNDFLMVVGERRIRGIIREKEEAREIYERARAMGHVASLLEQERPNIFRQRVANIEPGHAIEVELHYFNALPYRDGEFEFAFPLVVGPRFNPPGSTDPIGAVPRCTQPAGTAVSYLAPHERSGHDVAISVELDAGVRLEKIQCLNHAASVRRDGPSGAIVELSPHDRIPNKDFVLRYRVATDRVESAVLTHREGDEGWFSMMVVPPASLETLERAPVEFVFVLDCSGSMNGWPMEKSKSAMRRALGQLQPGDSFQVIRFSEQASALGPRPIEATPENLRRALDYVDRLHGSGGTMMIEGIKAALDFERTPGRERIVSFMTDGYIGNENEIFAAIAGRLDGARIFSFGVGQSVNRHLIEGMARMGRGAVAYIGLDDDLDAVDEFYRVVRHPALTDVSIDWGNMAAEQVFPARIPDLFVGRPILLHGRFEGEGRTTVVVKGRAAGREVAMEIEVDLDAPTERRALPLIWARSEIQSIADRLAGGSDSSLQSRGLDLALNYNLVSAWTSFVAVDASRAVDEPGERTVPVPVPVPDRVRHDTTVGGGH